MIARTLLFGGIATVVAVLHSSTGTIVLDTVVGVTIAVALFVLYYALVLRRTGGGHRRNS